MKVLLTGSNGMLGQAIKKVLSSDEVQVFGIDKTDADFCFDLLDDEKIGNCICQLKPDIIINAAAIVDINLCERDHGTAYCINGRLPGILAEQCRKYGIYFIQISTDHYYTDHGNRIHKETDKIELVNEYARSKYVGEQLALTYENSLVLRTNIVGFRGHGSPTFVEWALQTICSGEQMSLFNDFYTSSICVSDFAEILSEIIPLRPCGIYNLASSTVSSKKDFILALSNAVFGYIPDYKESSVKNIKGVKRGDSLGLDIRKIEVLLNRKMPDLNHTVEVLAKEYKERK